MQIGKLHIVLAALLVVLTGSGLMGQEQRVDLDHQEVPLRVVLDDMELQTGLKFSYSNRFIKDRQQVSISETGITLEQALGRLLEGRPVKLIFMEQQIILKKSNIPLTLNSENVGAALTAVSRYTIHGYARDQESGEVLIGATISVPGEAVGTITNNYGFYSLTLESKVDALNCSFVGYSPQIRSLSGKNQQLDFQLQEVAQSIMEVVIVEDQTIETVRTSRSSDQNIEPESVRKMPALFGEKDVIKSLAAIPGVKFFGDGSTIFYVRGGSRDQNLITIDEAPVYNPTHMMGFFSTVVPDAVKDIQVYKGDFPATYGGRISSLVDIRTKDGDMQQFGMDASFGLLSSRLSLEGPIWKDRISYFVSARRSYFLRPLQNANENINDLHFGDLHMKLNYRINPKNRIFFSIYSSVDNFETTEGQGSFAGINWQNSTATLRWNHIFSDRLFSNFTLYGSRYDYFLRTNIRQGDYWNSHIDNVSLKADFTWYISPENTLRFGLKSATHFMNPGNFYLGNSLLPLPYEISTRNANENSLYMSDQVILNDRISLRMGLRLTTWNNIGSAVEYSFSDNVPDSIHYAPGQLYHTYFTADPRLGLVYQTGPRGMLKMSYSRTSQFEHLITNSISPFSTLEVWLPSGPLIKPQFADQLTLGYTENFESSGLKWEVELYHKAMRNQIDYRDHASLLMNPFLEQELRFGKGRAYGLESMLSKNKGDFQGWISYTWSRSILQVPGVNNGDPYPSYGDRPHDLSLFLSYRISPRLEFSANFIYMTGAPFTAPTAFYYHENIQVPIYFKRNNDRLPDYHRMDVALNWDLRKKEGRFDHELIFSIYNLYGRKNPVAIHFNKIENRFDQLVVPYNFYDTPELVASQFYIYRFVPSLSYHFSF